VITKKGYAKLSSPLGFEHLIAPYLIKLIYWLGLLLIVVAGIMSYFSNGESGGVGRILLALGGMLLALLIWRLLSELLILAFNIYERLVEIRDLLSRQSQTPAVTQPSLRDSD
jgi:hypothetical protein